VAAAGRAEAAAERGRIEFVVRSERERPKWDPELYDRFKAERDRPFQDLMARLPEGDVHAVADLGCGTGEKTLRIAARWPKATIWGVDSSPEMLARARRSTAETRITWVEEDFQRWEAPRPLDRIISNAALHWAADQASLLERWSGMLGPGGVLAVQMPNNGREPAWMLAAALIKEAPWSDRLPAGVEPPVPRQGAEPASLSEGAWFLDILREAGLTAEVWETTYYHQHPAPSAIVEWMQGTTLRPVLTSLSPDDGERFLATLSERMEEAYPTRPGGVILPFRRLFFVARRPV
jgi:trans-aconitate 2-methyltransferase